MTPTTPRPANPSFSSGPCPKRPGWSLSALEGACLGRSHRSRPGKAKLAEVLERSRDILGLPEDYLIGVVPGSDTGAFELAMWTMLGARGVQALAWESFGKGWAADATKQLKLDDCVVSEAPYGEMVDLGAVDSDRDVLFAWNGTTSGVRVPNGAWIAEDRAGLTFCDATSAAFAMPLPWDRLDIVTYSWQKSLGGEAAHGVLILGPRAVQRLESHVPPWPLPKLFRLARGGELIAGVFKGETINTPSLLAVEDAVDALRWAETAGGLDGLIARVGANAHALEEWVESRDWIDYLPRDPEIRSTTSVCLRIVDPEISGLPAAGQSSFVRAMTDLLEFERAAYDVAGYRDAPPGLRIWCGPTVEAADVEALCPWLDWAFAETRRSLSTAA